MLGSAAIHIVHYLTLAQAYRFGDLSQVFSVGFALTVAAYTPVEGSGAPLGFAAILRGCC
jgi:hypothetical protein